MFVTLVTAAKMHFSITKCSVITNLAPLSDAFVYYILLSTLLLEKHATLKKKKEKVKGTKEGVKESHQKSRGIKSCVLTLYVQIVELTHLHSSIAESRTSRTSGICQE